ncbi:hypothetical protein [[Mycoplasma] mobile]|uniref:Expressed protein n=1 Tax=Mycoplasma mobile (strain ATCC 43663 / 163K / NCTC 11711) TaxID=267748 RepID=Q6KH79_MYCM1|nr:hypothetical protein [[Mycoplasma] mobile]AAT28051.1 expressed protein [Mycoplasma mobile 163K]
MAIIFNKNDHELIDLDGRKILVRFQSEEETSNKAINSFEDIQIKLKLLSEDTKEFYFSLFDNNSKINLVKDNNKIDLENIDPKFKEILTNIYSASKDLTIVKYAKIYSFYLKQLSDWKSLKMVLLDNPKINFRKWYEIYVELNVTEEIGRHFDIIVDKLSTKRNIDVNLSWVEKQKKQFLEFLNEFFTPKFYSNLEKEWNIQTNKFVKEEISKKPNGPTFNIVDEA